MSQLDFAVALTGLQKVWQDIDDLQFADAVWLAQFLSGGAAPQAVPAEPAPDAFAESASTETADDRNGSVPAGSDGELAKKPAPAGRGTAVYPHASLAEAGVPSIRVTSLRVRAGSALPESLRLTRALRALALKGESRNVLALDEDATVAATAANLGRLTPIVRPQRERLFDALLVVEQTASADAWTDSIVECERVLTYAGTFRDVRVQWLRAEGRPQLVSPAGRVSSTRTAVDPTGRRIVFLFSAGVSSAWSNGSMGEVLQPWARRMPVVLLHALPQALWKTTVLGEPTTVVRGTAAAAPNTSLQCRPAWWTEYLDLPSGGVRIPVVPLEPSSVRTWADVIAFRRSATALAYQVPTREQVRSSDASETRWKATVEDFRANASPEAFRLAVYLAAARFTMEMARLMQDVVLGRNARPHQIAEVMLSGLVERVAREKGAAVFAFRADARDALLTSLRPEDEERTKSIRLRRFSGPGGIDVDVVAATGERRIPASKEPFLYLSDGAPGPVESVPPARTRDPAPPSVPVEAGERADPEAALNVRVAELTNEILAAYERRVSNRPVDTEMLSAKLRISDAVVRGFFDVLVAQTIPVDSIRAKFGELAVRFARLHENIRLAQFGDPVVWQLKSRATTAIEGGPQSYDEADELLAAAEGFDRLATERAGLAFEARSRSMALTRMQRGELSLLRLDYETAIAHFEKGAALAAASNPDAHAQYLLVYASTLCEYGRERGENEALARAIEVLGVLAKDSRRDLAPAEWAALQHNLGDALATMGDRTNDMALLRAAVNAFRKALQEFTRQRDPLRWATILINIGVALSLLGEREHDAAQLGFACDAFESALQTYTRERFPLDWAKVQVQIGNAQKLRGEREGDVARLETAVEAYRAALLEYTRDRAPRQWAMVQTSLGNALSVLAESASRAALHELAVTAFGDALFERTRDSAPLDWAQTQHSLGITLTRLGEREPGTASLEAAAAAFRNALLERARGPVPLDWASTQHCLGIALTRLGEREIGTARLEQAVEAFGQALLERTRERVPLDWAATQNSLGNALGRLGERDPGTARLEEAVTAYRMALLERTRERVPLDWAITQHNLGNALSTLGLRETGSARLEDAVTAFRNALLERTRARVPLRWAATENDLGNALSVIGERESGTARLEEAVAAFREALLERRREQNPLDWAMTQNNLGNALTMLGKRKPGTALLEEAVAAFRSTLSEYTRERVPLKWAMAQNNLGNALTTLAKREPARLHLEQAVVAYRNALLEYTADRAPAHFRTVQKNLEVALAIIEKSGNRRPKRTLPRSQRPPKSM